MMVITTRMCNTFCKPYFIEHWILHLTNIRKKWVPRPCERIRVDHTEQASTLAITPIIIIRTPLNTIWYGGMGVPPVRIVITFIHLPFLHITEIWNLKTQNAPRRGATTSDQMQVNRAEQASTLIFSPLVINDWKNQITQFIYKIRIITSIRINPKNSG